MDSVKSLQVEIKKTLRRMLSGSMSPEDAAKALKSLQSKYDEISASLSPDEHASHMKGLLYHHNVYNLSKATGYFVIYPDFREIGFSGNRELIPLLEKTESEEILRWNRGVIMKKGLSRTKEISCYWYSFLRKEEIHALMAVSSSSFFEEERFLRLCRIMETLTSHDPGPALIDGTAAAVLTGLMEKQPEEALVSVYTMPGVHRILSHVTSAEYGEINNTILSVLKEKIPPESEIYSSSSFHYIILNDRPLKKGFSITIGEITITFTVRQYRTNDPTTPYRLTWEL